MIHQSCGDSYSCQQPVRAYNAQVEKQAVQNARECIGNIFATLPPRYRIEFNIVNRLTYTIVLLIALIVNSNYIIYQFRRIAYLKLGFEKKFLFSVLPSKRSMCSKYNV